MLPELSVPLDTLVSLPVPVEVSDELLSDPLLVSLLSAPAASPAVPADAFSAEPVEPCLVTSAEASAAAVVSCAEPSSTLPASVCEPAVLASVLLPAAAKEVRPVPDEYTGAAIMLKLSKTAANRLHNLLIFIQYPSPLIYIYILTMFQELKVSAPNCS